MVALWIDLHSVRNGGPAKRGPLYLLAYLLNTLHTWATSSCSVAGKGVNTSGWEEVEAEVDGDGDGVILGR